MTPQNLIAGDNMTMPFRLGAIAALALLGAMGSAGAETTTDLYGKELKIEPSHNIFARFGVLGLHLNNKSQAAKDTSGPVLSRPDSLTTPTPGNRGYGCQPSIDPDTGLRLPPCTDGPTTLYSGTTSNIIFHDTGVDSLGLPDNVKAKFSDPTPGAVGTLGMYFDEDHHWAVEVPVMALPFNIKIYGAGSFQNAGQIISAKALGFLVFGHYYFGNKNDKFRPSVSVTANYLVPFDVQATSSLEQWTGGKTKISSRGSLGAGFLVGGKYALSDRWDLNFNVGQFKAKVDSTLTTYDTILNGSSPIFAYWPGQLGANLRDAKRQNLLSGNLAALIDYRNFDPANRVNGGANLGTFTRTQSQTLDPYVVLMSVGYNF